MLPVALPEAAALEEVPDAEPELFAADLPAVEVALQFLSVQILTANDACVTHAAVVEAPPLVAAPLVAAAVWDAVPTDPPLSVTEVLTQLEPEPEATVWRSERAVVPVLSLRIVVLKQDISN